MTQASYYQPRKGAPGALAMVIALHAAGITGLALWKIDVSRSLPPIFETYDVIEPVEPDPIPPEPKVDPRPRPNDVVRPYVPDTIISLKPSDDAPMIDLTKTVTPPVWPPLGGETVGPVEPQPPRLGQVAKAKGDVRQLFTTDDYPAAALRREETGSVRARLAIGANGKVTGCSIVESSGSATLDQATCRILKQRARFTPAKDINGQLTSDSYVTPTISWQLVDQG